MRLPEELLTEIIRFSCEQDTGEFDIIRWDGRTYMDDFDGMVDDLQYPFGVLCACKRFNAIASMIVYGRHRFSFQAEHVRSLPEMFFGQIGVANAARIKRITLHTRSSIQREDPGIALSLGLVHPASPDPAAGESPEPPIPGLFRWFPALTNFVLCFHIWQREDDELNNHNDGTDLTLDFVRSMRDAISPFYKQLLIADERLGSRMAKTFFLEISTMIKSNVLAWHGEQIMAAQEQRIEDCCDGQGFPFGFLMDEAPY